MNLASHQQEILALHYGGQDAVAIAKALHRNTREVRAVIQLYAKKPGVEFGFRKLRELAKEAGVLK